MANTKIPVELSSTPGIVDNSNATAITIDSSENVGIGTTSPNTPAGNKSLHIAGTTGAELILQRDDSGVVADDFIGGLAFLNSDSSNTPPHYTGIVARATNQFGSGRLDFFGNFEEYPSGTPNMSMDNTGVGIGTTSPAEALTVVGTIRVQSASGDTDGLHISSDSGGDALINAGYSVSDLKFATNDTERMRIDSSGKAIFKGVTENELYSQFLSAGASSTVSGYIGRASSVVSGGTATDLGVGGGAGNLVFAAGGSSERMRIASSGSVLIGTTTDVSESQLNGALKLGIGVNTGIGLKRVSVASTATTVFDVSDFAPSNSSGDGLYMLSIVRSGGSYGTRFVGILAVDNASILLVETLENVGLTITVSGMLLKAAVSGTTVSCIATLQPLAIGE